MPRGHWPRHCKPLCAKQLPRAGGRLSATVLAILRRMGGALATHSGTRGSKLQARLPVAREATAVKLVLPTHCSDPRLQPARGGRARAAASRMGGALPTPARTPASTPQWAGERARLSTAWGELLQPTVKSSARSCRRANQLGARLLQQSWPYLHSARTPASSPHVAGERARLAAAWGELLQPLVGTPVLGPHSCARALRGRSLWPTRTRKARTRQHVARQTALQAPLFCPCSRPVSEAPRRQSLRRSARHPCRGAPSMPRVLHSACKESMTLDAAQMLSAASARHSCRRSAGAANFFSST